MLAGMVRAGASVAIALALSACGDRTPERAAPSAAPAIDAAAAPIVVDAAPTHSSGGLAVEPIEAGAPPPDGAPPRAIVVGGVRFVDRTGPGAVYLLEVASKDRRSIALTARALGGADRRLIREVKDRADACPDRNLTGFAPPSVAVTDVDSDGVAELGFGYLVGCAGGKIVAKQLLLEADAKYIVRGSAPDGGAPEPVAAQWPSGGLALAEAAYRDNAGALDVADAIGASGDRVIYDGIYAYETVALSRTSGGVAVDLSYPKLPMLARSEAGDLTTHMRGFLRVDERWERNQVGEQTGACHVELITPEVASVSCELMTDTRSRADHDQGMGGAPAGPAVLGLTIWRSPGREPVTAEELGAPPAIARCEWVLAPAGLTAIPDAYADAPCPDEPVEWAELKPTSLRAKALVTAMQAP